jgi:hypothetical protein
MYSIKIYSKAFTADEVLDDYQSDQYREVTPENALLWLPFRSQYDVAGVRVSDNLGKATGAPATVTMGDGTTSTTFPTQLSGGGISFDGGDYVDTTYVPIFTYNTPFTFAFVMRKNGQMPGTDSNIFATSDAAQSLKGMMVPQFGPYAVTWLYQTGTYYYKITHSDRLLRPLDAYVVVYDPTALFRLRSWVNGVETGIYGLANSNADFNSGKSLLIGARHNGAAKTAYSPAGVQVLFAACFPFALTPTQARYLHSLMIRRAI